jgi:hypothetical protein
VVAIHDRFSIALKKGTLANECGAVGVVEQHITREKSIPGDHFGRGWDANEVGPVQTPLSVYVVHTQLDHTAGIPLTDGKSRESLRHDFVQSN